MIDATMAPPSEGAYYLVFKHEVNKTLAVARANQVVHDARAHMYVLDAAVGAARHAG